MNFERKLSKEDREIYCCLKPFARFMEETAFIDIFEGLVLEKNLRQRLNQLKEYKKLGLRTYDDIEKYLEVDSRNKKDDKKNPILFDTSGIGLKLNEFLKKGNNQNFDNDMEKNLSKEFGITKSESLEIKKAIVKELLYEKSKIII